jgi:chromate reductase
MKILGLSGSLRRDSHNTNLLRAAARALPAGVDLEIYDGLRGLPLYDPDRDVHPIPAAAARLRGALAEADGVLIATPEYNGSIPAPLKNALDWASRPFPDNALRGKPVAVVGASTGLFGAVWAQAETRKVLGIIAAGRPGPHGLRRRRRAERPRRARGARAARRRPGRPGGRRHRSGGLD